MSVIMSVQFAVASERARVPPWLAPFWTPQLVSIGRCSRCARIYRRMYGRGPLSPCESCPGDVVQWKRCGKCRRWKPESAYHRIRGGRWLYYACRFCNCKAVAAARARRRAIDPVWADSVRKAHREYRERMRRKERGVVAI